MCLDKNLNILFTQNTDKGITEANISIDEALLSDGYSNSRNLLSVSSCGICGKKELEDMSGSQKLQNGNVTILCHIFGRQHRQVRG